MTKIGAGTLTLSGLTSHSGPTTISGGTLRIGAPNILPSGPTAGNVTVNGTLDLHGNNQTINGFSGAGVVDSTAAGTPTLTVGANNASGAFGGVIQNSSGTLSLTKTGSGTLTLNNNNTYSGATNITGGTLQLAITPSAAAGIPLANLKTWFDPSLTSSLTVSGGIVSAIANRAGPGDIASQATAGNQPTLNSSNTAFNSLPTLTFSGNQHLNGFNTSYLNGSSYTIFTVSAVGATGQQYMLGSNTGGNNTSLHFGYRNTNDFTLAQFANDLDYYSAQGYNGSSEVAMDWSGKLDTSSGHALYFNGGSAVASNGNTDALNSQTTASGILGAAFNNASPFNGDVGEVLIFNSALSDSQRAAVDAYLQTKWGIAGSSSWTSTVLPSSTPVTISGGGVLNLNGGNQTIGSLASSDATTQVQLGAGTLTVGNDGTSTAFAGSITGAGGLTKINGGTLTLSNGGSNYSGPTTINGGTLRVTNSSGSATGTSTVTINGATLSSGPVGTISGAVLAGTGTMDIAPGGVGAIGTLNVGSATINGSTTLHFDLNGLNADEINIGGAVTLSGMPTLIFDNAMSPVAGHTYTLATFTSETGGSGFNVVNLPAGFQLQLNSTNLLLVTTNGNAEWDSTLGGTYSDASKWYPTQLPSGLGLVATFGNGHTSPISGGAITVTVDGAETVGGLAFTNTGGTQYTLASDLINHPANGITLDNGMAAATVSDSANAMQTISTNLTFNGNVAFNVTSGSSLMITSGSISETNGSRSLTLNGGGTLALDSTPVNYSGATTIHNGTLRVSATSNIGASGGSGGAVLLDATGGAVSTLKIGNLQTVSSLTTSTDNNGGSATLEVQSGGSLTVAPATGTTTFQGKVQLDYGASGGSALAKSGVNDSTLVLNGPTVFQQNTTVQVNNGTLRINATGAPSVSTGVVATVISGATLELDGNVSALTDTTTPVQRAAVKNDGNLVVGDGVNPAHQQVGGIDPISGAGGSVTVLDGNTLTADHINQTSLVIGSGSVFTLAPSDSNGNPLGSLGGGFVLAGSLTPSSSFVAASGSLLGVGSTTSAVSPSLGGGLGGGATAAVPEPSAIVLAGLAGLMGLFTAVRRRRVD